MKKRKFLVGTILVSMLCVIGFSACGKNKEEEKVSTNSSKKSEDAVAVYFTKENLFYQSALEEYQRKNGVELNLHVFETEEELAKQYAAEGMTASGADIVLCGKNSSLNIEKLALEDTCLDLTSYLEQDKQYREENYCRAVLDAGKLNEKQYILPITYDLGFVVMRKEVDDLCENILTSQSTCYDFYKNLLACQEILYNSEEIRLGLCFPSNSTEELLLYVYYISGLDLTDGSEVVADAEKVQAICDFIQAGQKEFQDKLDEMKNAGQKSALLTGYQLLYGNPAAIVRQQEYAYEALFETTIDYFMVPSELSGEFHATVRDFGFISTKSNHKEQAYQVLRYLMDYDFYKLGIVYEEGVPVNQNNFESQFQELCGMTKVTIGNKSKQVSTMSEELKKKLKEQIEQVHSASFPCPDEEQIFVESMTDYVNGVASFESCFQQMCNRLSIYLKE